MKKLKVFIHNFINKIKKLLKKKNHNTDDNYPLW